MRMPRQHEIKTILDEMWFKDVLQVQEIVPDVLAWERCQGRWPTTITRGVLERSTVVRSAAGQFV